MDEKTALLGGQWRGTVRVTLNDGSLSEEAKRLRVTELLNTVILSEAASLNFEQGMAEQRGQTEILKR